MAFMIRKCSATLSPRSVAAEMANRAPRVASSCAINQGGFGEAFSRRRCAIVEPNRLCVHCRLGHVVPQTQITHMHGRTCKLAETERRDGTLEADCLKSTMRTQVHGSTYQCAGATAWCMN